MSMDIWMVYSVWSSVFVFSRLSMFSVLSLGSKGPMMRCAVFWVLALLVFSLSWLVYQLSRARLSFTCLFTLHSLSLTCHVLCSLSFFRSGWVVRTIQETSCLSPDLQEIYVSIKLCPISLAQHKYTINV